MATSALALAALFACAGRLVHGAPATLSSSTPCEFRSSWAVRLWDTAGILVPLNRPGVGRACRALPACG